MSLLQDPRALCYFLCLLKMRYHYWQLFTLRFKQSLVVKDGYVKAVFLPTLLCQHLLDCRAGISPRVQTLYPYLKNRKPHGYELWNLRFQQSAIRATIEYFPRSHESTFCSWRAFWSQGFHILSWCWLFPLKKRAGLVVRRHFVGFFWWNFAV
jgi:hypothetical protein